MKFKKSDLKRIIAEELSRSSELRRFLSERGEIKPGTVRANPNYDKKQPKGGRNYPFIADADVYGTDASHYSKGDDMVEFITGDAPGKEMTIPLDQYQGKFVPKLAIEDIEDSGMFSAGNLTQRQINTMFNKNTPAPEDQSAMANAIRDTKGRRLGQAIQKLLAAQAACDACDAEGMDQCSADIEAAIQIIMQMNLGFDITM